MVDKGVVWSVGKIFHGDLAALPVQPAAGGGPQAAGLHQPAAILRRGLSGRSRRRASCDRPALAQQGDRRSSSATTMWLLTIETPDGPYRLHAHYVIACDGARSSLRQMVGAEFAGQVFEDQFLIADVKMTAAFPTERWFWFDPPFHAGRSRAAAQAAGRHLADRSAAQPVCRSRRRKAAGECAAAASRACSATTSSISNGSRSTSSSAGGWTGSSMAA